MSTAFLPLADAGAAAGGSPDLLTLTAPPAVIAGDDGSNDSSGFLSGMGDLFSGIGSAVSSGLAASAIANRPPATGLVFNPQTGTYFNPATGQVVTSTGTLSSAGAFAGVTSNPLILILLAIAAFFILKKEE